MKFSSSAVVLDTKLKFKAYFNAHICIYTHAA